MSVEKRGKTWRVRWRSATGENKSRGPFASAGAAERFDRKVKDLIAAGELHLLDEQPRGVITLREYVRTVWMPEYAEVHLTAATRKNYATQLLLRVLPKWGDHRLADLRTGPIDAWVGQLRREGVGDPTILHSLAVLRSVCKKAVKDEEIERNPVVDVAKPGQQRTREPLMISPVYVELIRAQLLDPGVRLDKRGQRIPERDPLMRLADATLVSLLAYSGPRPESEALPLEWEQIQQRTILYRRTKHRGGRVTERATKLLGPLASDLAGYRLRLPAPTKLVFPDAADNVWPGHTWDNWRDRTFRPACEAVGLPGDVRPRDLRGSFASLLIFEGKNVVEVAKQMGSEPATILKYYAGVFEEFDPAHRQPAEDMIRDARKLVASKPRKALVADLLKADVPGQYPRALDASS